MTLEALLVLLILIGALVLFALELFTVDFVAIAVMATLMGFGLVTAQEGISGFSNPATITVLAMFVLSAGLYRTGAIDWLTEKLLPLSGRSETRQLWLVMLTVGPISAFLNNTAAVAILIPFTIKLARQSGCSPSKLLIPLSYTSQLAGVITLIGTSTNILTSALSQELGFGPLGMFEFTHLGLIVFVAGAGFLITVGRALLPERQVPPDITERFRLKQFISEVIVPPDSSFTGKTLAQLALNRRYGIDVVQIVRNGKSLPAPLAQRLLKENDSLIIHASAQDLVKLERFEHLLLQPQKDLGELDVKGEDMELSEVVIAPGSRLVGSTLKESDFRNRFGASVLAIHKHGEEISGQRMPDTVLRVGDTLLLKAPQRVLISMKAESSFIVTDDMRQTTHRTHKIPVAVAIIAGVVLLAAFGVQPILVTALEGCVLMVLTGCLRMRELHQAIRWDVVFLLAGIIPLGIAMQNTGTAQLLADAVVSASQGWPPLLVMSVLYLAVMLLTGLISNNATVVLLLPVAVTVAQNLGLDAKAFIIAVMFAASTSFYTPVGYQTNAMVMGPGGYKFIDFMRVGAPLNLFILAVTVLAITWLWGL